MDQEMIHDDELKKVCNLAKIRIEESEKEKFLKRLNQVFDWIDQLSRIETSNVNIGSLKDIGGTIEKKDLPSVTNSQEELLSNTKHKKFGMFCVPKVIE
ncbi:MAG: Asp-tRNA(Asn)/Glu-tRNA(Gln) amidotransferase subunit GatC [Holosporales bacterium]|jgi:aspartyl/glutamyl-tRNA(Asn/Gln) amidotransferase C subunit|nr:Asp-tRNA(Asn)/Glu-tRNA(Gln) amidotransferase subunit GatC [Holosporales bacterium]